ncbi:hypothetical protein QBC46DRAFT_412474 [Diplogelasinospora grovesii]|uniref:Uncharacterized protein n=1 Tax=Diplogelasinospora grovesii TaxID=303347 RepID=A0AAN6N0P6_9PEZI|nr:hypothetical protein QBC46DRAFT_412474 [Diplogelasinospora grovesii]
MVALCTRTLDLRFTCTYFRTELDDSLHIVLISLKIHTNANLCPNLYDEPMLDEPELDKAKFHKAQLDKNKPDTSKPEGPKLGEPKRAKLTMVEVVKHNLDGHKCLVKLHPITGIPREPLMPWEEAKAAFDAANLKREQDADRMLMDDDIWSPEQLAQAFSGSLDPWEYVWVDFELYGGRILPTKKFEPETPDLETFAQEWQVNQPATQIPKSKTPTHEPDSQKLEELSLKEDDEVVPRTN